MVNEMCFKRNKPVRLAKKKPSTLRVWYDFIKCLSKEPEFWLILCFVIAFIILIIVAIHEAQCYMIYNRGGIIVS